METYVHHKPILPKKQPKWLEAAEFNRFGIITVVLTIVGCMGGIAVGLGAINYTITLIAVVIPTMLTLSFLIAVAPMKAILISGIVATTIDLALIIYFLLV